MDNPRELRVFCTPSPPPWGWSTGFITTPLTTRRLPSQHLDPTLPKLFRFTPTFPTCLTVAEQFLDIKRTSLEGNFNVADLPSYATSFAIALAALTNCLPFLSVISMLCMVVPKGISVEVFSLLHLAYVLHVAFRLLDYEITSPLPHSTGNVEGISFSPEGIRQITIA
ncbi:hypothetical protein Lal_00043044 [Lupinus albus]|nr:hypothetical protein Lal_00043044 [Lupinus albus]